MRHAISLTVLAGCGFSPATLDAPTDGSIGAIDSLHSTDAAIPPPPPPNNPPCPADPALRLCLTFDGLAIGSEPSSIPDGSPAPTSVSAKKAKVISGRGGSPSLSFDGNSEVVVDLKTTVGPSATLDVWVRIDDADAQKRYGIIDDAVNFSIFFRQETDSTGGWLCGVGSDQVLSPLAPTPLRTWTHVAATCNGSVMRIYVDGSVRSVTNGCGVFTAPTVVYLGADKVPPDGEFADHLEGGLDVVRLWSRALTEAEVCQAAGRTGCPQ